MTRRAVIQVGLFAAIVAAAVGAFYFGPRARKSALPVRPDEAVVLVPHLQGVITLDGDVDDSGWLGPLAHSGPFVGTNGDIAHPFSQASITWGDGVLYVSLYAADEDIRVAAENEADVWKDDSFHVVFDDGKNERIFDVSAKGKIADATRPSRFAVPGDRPPANLAWESGAHASAEMDGTANQPSDDDEEWVIEMAIPLSSLYAEILASVCRWPCIGAIHRKMGREPARRGESAPPSF